jgi:Flp pilus assembly protein TadG
MTMSCTKNVTLLLLSAALSLGFATSTMAQDASDTAATTAAPTKAQKKAANKAARKQARAKKNAELKKLEDAGYNPSQNDPNYPDNLQKAQKKVGAAQGASQ